ncbi:TPA: 8-oxo-dGTP diphosphatase [Candidatus Woesearchaeota archaeon]|nr:8-oxo-dGTP diphosphatase [Candidatus Woesearchaeota archaeon]
MRDATLCYVVQDSRILLGMKKRGFGVGKWNGYGGKVNAQETIIQAALRELTEETTITTEQDHCEKVAEIDFHFADIPAEKNWDQRVHVFIVRKWNGEPAETEKMKPQWFHQQDLPLNQMWKDDPYWLPLIFEGKKIKATFTFKKEGEEIAHHTLASVERF